jgi:hypothetical protein
VGQVMNDAFPQAFTWDAERSVMVPRRKALADKTYVDQNEYRLGVIEERSAASHSHYFSALHEAFMNLPDDQAERFPTVDHLRKYALVQAGFRDERSIACASKAEALRVAAFIKPMDEYAVVIVREAVVLVYTAKSQSMKAMGKAEFQESKSKVLEIVSIMIGVTANDLSANTIRRQMRAEAS